MSTETPAETIERLEALNHKLSMQIIGMSDRVQGTILQVSSKAWEEGWEAAIDRIPENTWFYDNPYAAIIAEKEANR